MNKYHCFNRTANYKDKIEEIIQNKKLEIFSFFGIESDRDLKFNIYVYDTIEDLVKGMKETLQICLIICVHVKRMKIIH